MPEYVRTHCSTILKFWIQSAHLSFEICNVWCPAFVFWCKTWVIEFSRNSFCHSLKTCMTNDFRNCVCVWHILRAEKRGAKKKPWNLRQLLVQNDGLENHKIFCWKHLNCGITMPSGLAPFANEEISQFSSYFFDFATHEHSIWICTLEQYVDFWWTSQERWASENITILWATNCYPLRLKLSEKAFHLEFIYLLTGAKGYAWWLSGCGVWRRKTLCSCFCCCYTWNCYALWEWQCMRENSTHQYN